MSLFYRYQTAFFRVFLCLITTAVVVYLLPRGASFQYEIQEGKPWQYETLLAPYDFPIQKSKEELDIERDALDASVPRYFSIQPDVIRIVLDDFDLYAATLPANPNFSAVLINWRTMLEEMYAYGVIADISTTDENESIALVNGTRQTTVNISDLYTEIEAKGLLTSQLDAFESEILSETSLQYLLSLVVPNVAFNEELTRQFKEEAVAEIITVRGLVTKGTRIIAKGEVVEGEKLQKLKSLQLEFESQTWTQSNTTWIILGYSLLVFIPVVLLFVFLWRTRPTVFENNKRLMFLCVNILLMVLLTKAVVDVDPQYIYAVPICMLPLLMRTFFDTRVALFTLLIALFLIAFLIPNSFEFIYLQIMAGILASLTVNDLYRRAKLFISVILIVGLYAISYVAFTLIHDGNLLHVCD